MAMNLFTLISKVTTSQAAILFQLYYGGNNVNQMNAEDEDNFLHHFAIEVKTQIWLNDTQLLLFRTSMLEVCGFMCTLWWLL